MIEAFSGPWGIVKLVGLVALVILVIIRLTGRRSGPQEGVGGASFVTAEPATVRDMPTNTDADREPVLVPSPLTPRSRHLEPGAKHFLFGPDAFQPLHEGQGALADGDVGPVKTVEVGSLHVWSGKVWAFGDYLDSHLEFDLPPGDYPVVLTLADVSGGEDTEHLRQAFLSVVVKDTPTTQYEVAHGITAEGWREVWVDAGCAGFADAELSAGLPDDFHDGDGFDDWSDLLYDDHHIVYGAANCPADEVRPGANAILCQSGWGDGSYHVLESFDADGALTGIHIDFGILRNALHACEESCTRGFEEIDAGAVTLR